jgi:NADH:ubiquinone oxidoreductase subunit F (NADH-binding)/(2Fe-2S) ferredoxin
MASIYEELLERANARWAQLDDSDTPWVRVQGGTSGQAAGSDEVLATIREAVKSAGVKANVTSVSAIGLMYLEPIVDVKLPNAPRVLYGNVTPEFATEIVDKHVRGGQVIANRAFAYWGDRSTAPAGIPHIEDLPAFAKQTRIVTRNFGTTDPHDLLHYVANGGYSALNRALHEQTPEAIVNEVKASGLRGRGGAAFPTGVKWSFLAPNKAPVKYVLCNCEEGDPGAFNDKGILENDPHTLVEGLIINGYATNSTHGYVFIRQGHDIPINATRKAIRDAYEAGLLGKNIMGSNFSFEMEVALTGDSYVAGEETALMEAIEGKRSTPRFKPPFPAAAGLWQKPTNINNVKTISYVPSIVSNSASWFKSTGTEKSSGTAIVCLSGHIKRPGMYEIAMGMTVREVLEEIGGGVEGGNEIKVLQTGGPLGGVLGAEAFDVEIDFDAMSKAGAILGSGGIIVGNEKTDVVDLIRNLIAFTQFESCGKCFPCRLGNTHMLEVLDRMCKNEGRAGDLQLIEKVGMNMKVGSLCGHGQLGFNPIASALKYFGKDFEERMSGSLAPAGSFEDGSMIMPTRTRP